MFTKKSKRNYRMAVWSAVVVCLCILIIYFAWPEKPQENAGSGMNPDYNPSAAASSKSSSSGASIDKYLDDESDSDDELKIKCEKTSLETNELKTNRLIISGIDVTDELIELFLKNNHPLSN